MQNLSKKEREELCLNIVLENCLSGYNVDTSRRDNGIEEENPDFLLVKGDKKIGVEHFSVDTLLSCKDNGSDIKYNSLSHQISKEVMSIYNEYSGGRLLGREGEFLDKKAVCDILREVHLNFQRAQDFSCLDFERAFCKIVNKHVNSVDRYKEKSGISTVGFVCEVNVFNPRYEWNVLKIPMNNSCVQKVCPFPVTVRVWNKISEVLKRTDIDFFIVVAVQNFSNDYYKSAEIKYYDREVSPDVLYDCFSYYLPDSVKRFLGGSNRC